MKERNGLLAQLTIAFMVTVLSRPAFAEAWDDAAEGFKDAMFGDIATYLSIIAVGAAVIAAASKKATWAAPIAAGALVCVYWMSPAIVTFAKKMAGV